MSWLMETSFTLFSNSPISEALYQVMDALTMKYRDSGTTAMRSCGLKARYSVLSCVHRPMRSRGVDSVQTTGEQYACLQDATSAFDFGDNLDEQSGKKEILELT